MASPPPSEITVVGAGGIGCSLAHALATGGMDVRVVDINERKIRWGEENGIHVDDRPPARVHMESFESWTPASGGIILLCTKCFDNEVVLQRLGTDSHIIPVQNGFDMTLAERCRFEGIASYVSECIADKTHVHITRPGDLHIGPSGSGSNPPPPPGYQLVIDLLELHGAFTVRRVQSILPFMYTKLMYNAAIGPLAAVSGCDNSQLLTIPRARKLFFRFLRENHAILAHAQVPLGTIGPFHPDTVNRILRIPLLARVMAGSFARSLRNTYCSMSGDIEKGRTEIENFNGHLVTLASTLPCDLNRRSCALVTRMQSDRDTPSLARLDELVA